tara:strand:+ start:1462 stop:9834 length:8373 start_codon:yes stop_codon:yes gene_type:complete
MSQVQPNPDPKPEPEPTPEEQFESKVGAFAEQRKARKFYSNQDYTFGDDDVLESEISGIGARFQAGMDAIEKAKEFDAKGPRFEAPENAADIEQQLFQRDIQLQARNEEERINHRLNLAKEERLDQIRQDTKRMYRQEDMTPSEQSRQASILRKFRKKELERKYTLDDVVEQGRVFNPNQFASVPIMDDEGNYVGRARLNRKYYDESGQILPNSVTRKELDEMGYDEPAGELVMFDQNATPDSVFKFLNRNGDGTKLAQYAKHLDELDILYKRNMDPLERISAGVQHVVVEGFLKSTQNQLLSFGSVINDIILRASNGKAGTSEFDFQAARAKMRPVYVDDLPTEIASGVAQAIPALVAVAVTAYATKNPAAAARVGAGGLRQLAGRAILNGSQGLFANSMAYLAYKGDFEAEYLQQGMSKEDATFNAYLDAGAGVLATLFSTKLLAGTGSFLMKNKKFQEAFVAAARYKMPHIMATGFTREAIQEGLDEAFHTSLTAVVDRADLFGVREDGDWMIGARELLMSALVGGTIGGSFGAGLDMVSVTNAIDAEFKKGRGPKVGEEARGPDGQPLDYVAGDNTYDANTGEKISDPDAVDPTSPDGKTYSQNRVLRKGKVPKVTEENQAKYEREWKKRFYQNFVKSQIEETTTGERHSFLKEAVNRLRDFSLTKGMDPEMFGDPRTEVYRGGGQASGQRKIDLVSTDAELAYALAGETPPNDARLGENTSTRDGRGFGKLEGDSRKDYERAGLGWMVKGMNQQQRAALRLKAQESVARHKNEVSRQDARAQEMLDKASKAYGGYVPPEVELKIRAKAEADVRQEIEEETSAQAWLDREDSGPSPRDKVGPRTPVEGVPPAEQVVAAAQEAALPLPTDPEEGTDARQERRSAPRRFVERLVKRYKNAGKVKGDVVEAPSQEAKDLQDAMMQIGVPVVFVEGMTGGEAAVRDRDTGVILVNAANFSDIASPEIRNTAISAVVAHEFVHTLQSEHPQAYAALTKALGDVSPELFMESARAFLVDKAATRAREKGIELPDQDFTDSELIDLIKNNPEVALEIVPYAVQNLVENITVDAEGKVGTGTKKYQREALVNAMKGMPRKGLNRFLFRMRNMFTAMKSSGSLTQAWKSMKNWDALIDAFEIAAADFGQVGPLDTEGPVGPDGALPEGRAPPQLPEGRDPALPEGRSPALPQGRNPALPEAETLEEAIGAALEIADSTESLDDIREERVRGAEGRQMQFEFPEGTSSHVFEQPVVDPPVQTDPLDRSSTRAKRSRAKELADRRKQVGKAAANHARRLAKQRRKIVADRILSERADTGSSNPQHAAKGIARNIVTESMDAAEQGLRLTQGPPTKAQVVQQTIRDMLEEDPEGYEGILPALINYAVTDGGMSQADAEAFVFTATQKGHIKEGQAVFEQGMFSDSVEVAVSMRGDFDQDNVADEEVDYDASRIPRNWESRTLPTRDKSFGRLHKKFGRPKITVTGRTEVQSDNAYDLMRQAAYEEFNLSDSDFQDLFDEIQNGTADPQAQQLFIDIQDELDVHENYYKSRVTTGTPIDIGDLAKEELPDLSVGGYLAVEVEIPPPAGHIPQRAMDLDSNQRRRRGSQDETMLGPHTPRAREWLERQPNYILRIVMDGETGDGSVGLSFMVAAPGSRDMDYGQQINQPKEVSQYIFGVVDRVVRSAGAKGLFDRGGAAFSGSDNNPKRQDLYRRYVYQVAAALRNRGVRSAVVESYNLAGGGSTSAFVLQDEDGKINSGTEQGTAIVNNLERTRRTNENVIDGIENAISSFSQPDILPDNVVRAAENVVLALTDVSLMANDQTQQVSNNKFKDRTPEESRQDFENQINKHNDVIDKIDVLVEVAGEARLRASANGDSALVAALDQFVEVKERVHLTRVTLDVPPSAKVDVDVKYDASMMNGRSLAGLFRSRGDLPPGVFDAKFRKDSRIRAAQDQVNFRASQLSAAVSAEAKEAGMSKEQLTQLVDLALKDTRMMEKLPSRTRTAAEGMRNDIDKMTDLLIDIGAISGELAVSVRANKGFYVHRSYRVFDDPNWAKKVPKDVRNKMKRYLIRTAAEDGKRMTDEEAEIIVKQLLLKGAESDSPMAILASGKGGVVADVLKRRKKIAPELAALWGEYDDPNVNYGKSMQKMAQLAATWRFTNETAREGSGSFIFDEAQGDAVVQFPTDRGRYGGLAGKYTTPEFMNAWENAHTTETNTSAVAGVYYRGVAAVKWGKTIGSPMTHVRNMVGNIGFAIANGHVGLNSAGAVADLWNTMPFVKSWKSGEKERAQQEYNRLVELGVVQGGNVQDIIDLIDAANETGLTVPDFLKQLQDNTVARVAGKSAEALIDAANRLYSFEDDAWKIYAFSFEKQRYEEAYTKAGQPVPTDLDERVAKIIRDTYPNYNMPGRLLRGLRRTPFVGTFVSFPFEVLRTGVERLRITHGELSDPVLRGIGMKRAMGQLVAYNMGWSFAKTVTALFGIDEDEVDALREMVPPWAQNSPLIVYKNEKGQYEYIDIGYTDPFAYFARPVYALMRGESFNEAMFGSSDGLRRGAMDEILAPFIEEDMVFGSLLEAYNGKTKSGRPLYARADSRMIKIQKLAEHIAGDFAPGAYNQLFKIPMRILQDKTDDYGNSYNWRSHALSIATGFKQQPINPEQAFSFHCRTFAKMEIELRGQLTRVAGRAGTVDDSELEFAYNTVNAAREQNLRGFQRILRAADRLNIPERRRAELMYSAGVARKNIPALIRNVHIPVQIDSDFLERNVRRSKLNNPDAPLSQRDETRRRLLKLRALQKEATSSR